MTAIAYKVLCFVRFALLFYPQTGYIHPDEHFQGPEPVYGDILQLKVQRPWEFTSAKPIRSIIFPYLVTGVPALIADFVGIQNLHGSYWYPYLLFIMPRMVMCCLSFLNDFLLYKLCLLLKWDHKLPLNLFASSYVTLVYLPRTFSNSIEVLLFSALLFIISKLLHLKNSLSAPCHSLRFIYTSFLLGALVALGVFNRPTFLCFAVFPIAVFLYLISQLKRDVTNHLASFMLGGLCILLVFTSIDTFYYTQIHFLDILMKTNPVAFLYLLTDKVKSCLSLIILSYIAEVNRPIGMPHVIEMIALVVILLVLMTGLITLKRSAPNRSFLNFPYTSFLLGALIARGVFHKPAFIILSVFPLLITLQAKNKLNHIVTFLLGGAGLFLAHTSVNIFLNGKTHYSTLTMMAHNITNLMSSHIINTPFNFLLYNTDKSNLKTHGLHPWWLHVCVNIPLLFSVYGIKLMLDFIPLLRNLTVRDLKCFLVISFITPLLLLSLIPHQEPRFLIPLIVPLVLLHTAPIRFSCFVTNIWYISNIFAVLFYGFLHQGGVYLSSSYLHAELFKLESVNHTAAVFFYKTYQPPQYLFGLQNTCNTKVYGLDGISLEDFELYVNSRVSESAYIVTSHEISESVVNSGMFQKHYSDLEHKQFFPHLSTENLPSLSKVVSVVSDNSSVLDKLKQIKAMLSIELFIFKDPA